MADNIIGTKIVIDSDQAVSSVGSIKKQLREATQDLVAMADKFGQGSQEAINAAKRVAELRDRIGDAKSMADAFNPDAKFKAFSQSLQGVAGAFAVVQGAMASFGVESEDLQKTLVRVQGALALTEGLNTFLDSGIQGFKNLASVAKNAFMTIKAEIGSTGIGALLLAAGAAVYALYENFDKLTGVTEEAARANKAYNDTLQETNQAGAKAIENVTNVKVAFDEAKQGVISKDEALKIYNDTLGDSLGRTNSLESAEKILNSKADAYVKATMLKAQANAMFALSAKLQAEQLTADQKDNTSLLEKFGAGLSLITGQWSSYSEAIKAKNKENTAEIKKGLTEQVKTLETEGAKLLKQATDIERTTGIKIGAKGQKAKASGETTGGKIEKTNIDSIESIQIDAIDRLGLAYKKLDVIRTESALKNQETTNMAIELARKEAQARKQAYSEIADALGILASAADQGSDLQKGLALAQIAIDTGLAISNLTATSSAPTPDNLATGGISGFAKYAVGIAKILSNLAAARNIIKSANANSGGGSPTQGGMSAPVAPASQIQQTITSLNQGTINALGNQAIKAYVLESDVTNSQGRVTRILNSSRFK